MSLVPSPSMQVPVGPACIFLRKGIAEKQRVRWQHAFNCQAFR